MKKAILCACPICQSTDNELFFKIDCGNLDNSTLYPTVRLRNCRHCGHSFNELSADELVGLANYYNDEYAPANLGISDKTGDRPGSTGILTTKRYEQLYQVLSPHISHQQNIMDVGCALGGFLDFMNSKGFSKLAGVDSTRTYVEQARQKKSYPIEIGDAESLPFDDHTFDVIVMEQVMEHLSNPLKAFQEARRVLKDDGIFCIGVPDAARYADCYFFDFYWLLLREHIQHFDIAHLLLMAKQLDFELLDYHETVHAIMTEQMLMPNLYAIFRQINPTSKRDQSDFDHFRLKQLMEAYLRKEKYRQSLKCQHIEKLISSQVPVYVWGIGREFLYLYESANLKHCKLAGLIDANPFKLSSCTVGGMKISKAEDLLHAASTDAVLFITAIAHTDAIRNSVKKLGFRGKLIDLREHAVYE